MISHNFVHSILWFGGVLLAALACATMTLQVKAVNSDIAATERQILATKKQLVVLETEFQTRARQQQLVRWNEVDFGYRAPRADQFLTTGTAIAALGKRVIDENAVLLAEAETATARFAEAAPAVNVASAGNETAIRQLAAFEERASEPDPKPAAAPAPPTRFAEKFDLDAVIAGSEEDR